jgi:hypothetical protein
MLDECDPQYRDRPSVHLIPNIARQFDVQRRIAAWRLLLVSGLHDWILVRARIGNDEGPLFDDDVAPPTTWTTLWYVGGGLKRKPESVKGYSVPFDSRRRIPPDMIPDVSAETASVRLDGRWWDGTRAQPTDVARRPMKLRRADCAGIGYAARIANSLYVGLRNTDEP